LKKSACRALQVAQGADVIRFRCWSASLLAYHVRTSHHMSCWQYCLVWRLVGLGDRCLSLADR